MTDESHVADYPIAAVSKLTGVSCHTLRVWERRYGFPVPDRTPSGHRRYRAEQVDLLREVARRVRHGESLASLLADAREGRLSPTVKPEPSEAQDNPVGRLLNDLMAAEMDRAEQQYQRMTRGMTPAQIAERVIEPALTDAGDAWFRRDASLHQERIASAFLLRKLATLIDQVQRANTTAQVRRRVVVGTLQGDRHEGGALMLCLSLELHGWRSLYLGADMPVHEVREAVRDWHPDAIGFSFVLSHTVRKRFHELSEVEGVPVIVGGRSVVNYQTLARQCGLIPVLGSALSVLGGFLDRFEEWKDCDPRSLARHGEPPG